MRCGDSRLERERICRWRDFCFFTAEKKRYAAIRRGPSAYRCVSLFLCGKKTKITPPANSFSLQSAVSTSHNKALFLQEVLDAFLFQPHCLFQVHKFCRHA